MRTTMEKVNKENLSTVHAENDRSAAKSVTEPEEPDSSLKSGDGQGREAPTPESSTLFVVRSFDASRNVWSDESPSLPLGEAEAFWRERTGAGTRNTRFGEGLFYKVFPANVVMISKK